MSHVPNERVYCCNCDALREMSVHGRCGNCDSGSVVSEHAQYLGQEALEEIRIVAERDMSAMIKKQEQAAREVDEPERMVGVGRKP